MPQTDSWRNIPLIDDGKIAPGWTFTGFGEFHVVDGALRAAPDARGLGLLYYEKEKFGDCRIRIVYRTEKELSNSGVYLRIGDDQPAAKEMPPVTRDAEGNPTPEGDAAMRKASAEHLGPWYAVHNGYEVQICDNGDPNHGTGAIYSLAKAEPAVKPQPGQWRTMIITLEGERITVELDGVKRTTFDPTSDKLPRREEWYEPDREPVRPKSGYLGLQTHDVGDVVDFKEVSVSRVEN